MIELCSIIMYQVATKLLLLFTTEIKEYTIALK